MGHERPKTTRSGVMARLVSKSRSVQSPSVFVTKLMGLAVRSPVHPRHASIARGARQTAHTPIMSATRPRRVMGSLPRISVVFLQVHSGIEGRHLVRVAVEGQRLATPELADPPLGGLAPARVVDGRVDVRVETVLLRRGLVPGRLRLLRG